MTSGDGSKALLYSKESTIMTRELDRVYAHILTKPGGAEVQQEFVAFFKTNYSDFNFVRSYCHVNDDLVELGLQPIWELDPKMAVYMMRNHILKTRRIDLYYGAIYPGNTYMEFLEAYDKENL